MTCASDSRRAIRSRLLAWVLCGPLVAAGSLAVAGGALGGTGRGQPFDTVRVVRDLRYPPSQPLIARVRTLTASELEALRLRTRSANPVRELGSVRLARPEASSEGDTASAHPLSLPAERAVPLGAR